MILPKDYVNYKLTVGYCCDESDASGMLLDVARRLYRALYPILKDTYHALAGR